MCFGVATIVLYIYEVYTVTDTQYYTKMFYCVLSCTWTCYVRVVIEGCVV